MARPGGLLAVLALFAASPALAQTAAGTPDAVVPVSQEDREMNAAIAAARQALPEFLAVVDSPPAGVRDVAFKYPLEGWEHIWVSDVRRRGDRLEGKLDNEPQAEGHVLGEQVSVPLAEVSDWGYRGADGVMRGHRTTRVLLVHLDPEEAEQVRQWLGWKD